MNTALSILVVGVMVIVGILAALLNPGLGVLFLLLAVLAGIYAVRSVAAKMRRKRLRKNTRHKTP